MDQWSALPGDLIKAIEERLHGWTDKVRLRAVCTAWQSNLPNIPNYKLCQLPWLLLRGQDETSFKLLNPLEKRAYNIELPDHHHGKVFRGSSHGWVVVVEERPAIYVINPMTGAQFQLPPRSTFPDVVEYSDDKQYRLKSFYGYREVHTVGSTTVRDWFLTKVVMSSPPTSKDWVAVAIYGEFNKLAYCKYGSKRWTSLRKGRAYRDVIFHKEQFYALDFKGQLMAFNVGSHTKMTQICTSTSRYSLLYLVEAFSGELMMLERIVGDPTHLCSDDPKKLITYKTDGFDIYKFDTNNSSWCPVKNIGDDVFFVGLNSSLAFSSRDFPGCKGNCIYFTDDLLQYHSEDVEKGQDVGVFHVGDGTIEPLPGYTCDSHFVSLLPIWVMPNPCN